MPDDPKPDAPASEALEDPIPHSYPDIGAKEIEAVRASMEAGWIGQGPGVAQLEDAAGGLLGLPDHRGLALSSGTAALYAGLRALGVGPGDEVLVAAYACASLRQAVMYVGATPIFIDCDPVTFNPDPEDAHRKLGAETAASIVPHMFGLPADIEAFVELGPPVIEDCAQTVGVRLGDRVAGSFGALTVCSFHATKPIGGGNGGMLLSQDSGLLAKAAELRDCEDPRGNDLAFNFKMSDLHAAIAHVQLRRLPELLDRRRELAAHHRAALQDAGVDLPPAADDREHGWWRFIVTADVTDLEALLEACRRHGVSCDRPVGRLVREVVNGLDDLPGCRQAWQQACSIPLYPALSDERAAQAVERFKAALEEHRAASTG